jgi:hypothetical protein
MMAFETMGSETVDAVAIDLVTMGSGTMGSETMGSAAMNSVDRASSVAVFAGGVRSRRGAVPTTRGCSRSRRRPST